MRNPRINKRRIKEAVDLLAQQGVAQPKVREVAEQAGVSTGTAHRYLKELQPDAILKEGFDPIQVAEELEALLDKEDAIRAEENKARPTEREITSKFEGKCSECGGHVAKGEQVYYEPNGLKGKKIRHQECPVQNEDPSDSKGQEPNPDAEPGEGDPSEGGAPPPPRPDGAGEDDFTPYSYVDAQDAALRETLTSVAKTTVQNLQSIERHTATLHKHDVKLVDLTTEQSLQKLALGAAKDHFNRLTTRVDGHDKDIDKLNKKVGKLSRGTGGNLKIQINEVTIELGEGETLHAQAEKAAKILKTLNVLWLCGPTGSGKTHLAAQLAQILGARSFAPYSCTQGMTEGQLLGRLGFDNIFLSTPFVDCYENGGLVLLDEYDALNDNVRLVTNSAIANEILSLPNRIDKPVATRHADFLLVIGTNTWGYGSDDFYTGRDTIDGATQDRFALAKILLDYDPLLETSIPGFEDFEPADLYDTKVKADRIPTDTAKLPQVLEDLRANSRAHDMQQEVSTRTKINAAKLRDSAGMNTREIVEIFLTGWADRDVTKILDGVVR